jgi:mannose-6-phosphate isomerase-like protein (cupin superfamily)
MHRFAIYAVIPLAFAGGMIVDRTMPASAADATLTPRVIDLAAMTDAQIGTPNQSGLRQLMLAQTNNGSVQVQSGFTPKHTHTNSDEMQYIIAGSGKFWLGDKQQDVHPGDLVIIPKGTAHAGVVLAAGSVPMRALSIHLPPQAPGDAHLVP